MSNTVVEDTSSILIWPEVGSTDTSQITDAGSQHHCQMTLLPLSHIHEENHGIIVLLWIAILCCLWMQPSQRNNFSNLSTLLGRKNPTFLTTLRRRCILSIKLSIPISVTYCQGANRLPLPWEHSMAAPGKSSPEGSSLLKCFGTSDASRM